MYNAGYFNERAVVLNRDEAQTQHGAKKQGEWIRAGVIWCRKDFSRGVKALREGALDAYETVMIRTRWTDILTRASRLEINGTVYQIESFNSDKRQNQIQLTCFEMVNG